MQVCGPELQHLNTDRPVCLEEYEKECEKVSIVLAATRAIKAANKAVLEIVSEFSAISACGDDYSVSVSQLRDLAQIPGEIEYIHRPYREEFPAKARKIFDGVEFYILLAPEEARAINEQAASA